MKVKMEMTGNSWCPRRALHPGLYQQLRGGEGFLDYILDFVTIEPEVFFNVEFNNVDYVMVTVTVEIAENLNYR